MLTEEQLKRLREANDRRRKSFAEKLMEAQRLKRRREEYDEDDCA